MTDLEILLLEALLDILNGSRLDEFNRNDDGMRDVVSGFDVSKQMLRRWRDVASAAIDNARAHAAERQGSGEAG